MGQSEEINLGLRILWGGGEFRSYSGLVSIEQGTIGPFQTLGVHPSNLGDVIAESNRAIRISTASDSNFGGADFQVRGHRNSRLTIRFDGRTEKGEVPSGSWTLGELSKESFAVQLDTNGNRLVLARSPGDVLRIQTKRPHLVFEPSETIPLEGSVAFSPLPAGSAKLTLRLFRDSDPKQIEERIVHLEVDTFGSVPAFRLPLFNAPMAEGPHQIKMTIEPRKKMGSFLRSNVSLERTVEFVVVAKSRESAPDIDWETIQAFQPTESDARDFPLLRKITGLVHRDEIQEQESGVLAPGQQWTLKLDIQKVGSPHMIVVRSLREPGVECAMSIMEPNALGYVEGMTLDTGIVGPVYAGPEGPSLKEHRFVFWPKSDNCHLLLSNVSSQIDCKIEGIELMAGPQRLSGSNPAQPGHAIALPEEANSRLVAVHIDKPFFQEGMGGPKWIDPRTSRPLDTWRTFFDAAEHLADYCHAMGYNGASITIAGEGGALFPSKVLSATPRLDSGIFASDGRDPIQKDVVELLMRIFEREGLQLVLACDFSGPLARLEAARPISVVSVWPTDQASCDGKPWNQAEAIAEASNPLYDPLDKRLQQTIQDLFRELNQRYSSHSCWMGNGIRLSPTCNLQFAGDLWGYSSASLEEFEKTIQAKLPSDMAHKKEILLGTSRNAWLTWRAQRVATFFSSLGDEISKPAPDRKLFLYTSGLFEDQPTTKTFREPMRAVANPVDTLLAYGTDIKSFATMQNVVLLRGETSKPLETLARSKWSLLTATDVSLDEAFRSLTNKGSQRNETPKKLVVRGEAIERLFGKGKLETSIFPQPTMESSNARHSLLSRMIANDCQYVFEGGWFPSLEKEDEQINLRRTITRLPKTPLQEIDSTIQADPRSRSAIKGSGVVGGVHSMVSVRSGFDSGYRYVLLTNQSPWQESIQLKWNEPSMQRVEWLSDTNPLVTDGALSSIPSGIQLPPFSMAAFRIAEDGLQLRSWQHQSSEQGLLWSTQALARFNDRLNRTLSFKNEFDLPNGNFEEANPKGTSVIGWTSSLTPKGTVQLDRNEPYEGMHSLRIENRSTQSSAWIQSPPLARPVNDRLACDFFVRADNTREPIQLSMTVTGTRNNGTKFQASRAIDIPKQEGRRVVDPSGGPQTRVTWTHCLQPLLQNDSLETLSQVQVSFELRGIGTVWLDQIALYDLYLLEEERRALRAEVFLAKRDLEAGQLGSTQRLLESYWSRFLTQIGEPTSPSLSNRTIPIAREVAPHSKEGASREDPPPAPRSVKSRIADEPKNASKKEVNNQEVNETSRTWLQRIRENWGSKKKR